MNEMRWDEEILLNCILHIRFLTRFRETNIRELIPKCSRNFVWYRKETIMTSVVCKKYEFLQWELLWAHSGGRAAHPSSQAKPTRRPQICSAPIYCLEKTLFRLAFRPNKCSNYDIWHCVHENGGACGKLPYQIIKWILCNKHWCI